MPLFSLDAISDFDLDNDWSGACELMVLILTDRIANRTRVALLKALAAEGSGSVLLNNADFYAHEILAIMEFGAHDAIRSGRVTMGRLIDLVRDPHLLRDLFDLLDEPWDRET